jgi:uncharacterized protein YbjT (DUF2867 family)
MNNVLVIGATGGTGVRIAKKLLARKLKVRIIARNEQKARRLFEATGAEIIISDLTAPNNEFYEAFNGVDDIFFTAGVPMGFAKEDKIRQVDFQGVVYALQAAKAANFSGRFYYMTTIGCYKSSLFMSILNTYKKNLRHWRIEAENAIRESGIKYNIIRAGILLNRSSRTGAVRVYSEDIPITFMTTISREDVANVFINCMEEPDTVNKAFSIVSGKTSDPLEEQLLGK